MVRGELYASMWNEQLKSSNTAQDENQEDSGHGDNPTDGGEIQASGDTSIPC